MADVCVVGAGAIGGIVAARMALAGHRVSVVARGAHLQAIREGGLVLDDRLNGAEHTVKLAASDDPGAFGRQDLVVIGLKGPAIPAMLPRLAPLVGSDTLVVPAINGIPWWYFHRAGAPHAGRRIACLDPRGDLFAALDCDRVIGCVVLLAGEVSRPGTVVHLAVSKMIIGEPSGELTPRLRRLAGWWNGSGLEAVLSSQIRREIWMKLTGNLSFNTVAALTGCRTDQLIEDPDLVEVLRAMIEEGRRVAAACGAPVDIDADARIRMARAIGRARPSTLQDFEAGRRPEIEGLIGSVIELADQAGVPVPTIRHVAALLTARARSLGLLEALPAVPAAGTNAP